MQENEPHLNSRNVSNRKHIGKPWHEASDSLWSTEIDLTNLDQTSTVTDPEDKSDSNPELLAEPPGNEPPDNSTVTESEEKSELNRNHRTNNPDHQIPHHTANLNLTPRRKSRHKIVSSSHIDPKMGHLKRAHLAANSKSKDWTKVILQHPHART